MIPRAVSALFPPAIRSRGDAYWTSSRVRIEQADARVIRARIRGARIYAVEIDAEPGVIGLSCNCPYAIDSGICKHLWALFRVANHKEVLEPLLRTAGPDAKFAFRTATNPVPDLAESEPSPQEPAPDWKRTIARARAQMSHAEVGALPPHAAWPENRRLVYLLDVETSARANGVVIDLGLEALRKDGTWSEPRRFTLARELWFASPDADDQAIAQMLIGADPTNAHGAGRTDGFVIPARALDLAFRRIVDTGRCRTRSTNPAWSGRTIQFDGGAPWEFQLRVQAKESSAFTMDGTLVRADAELPLSATVFINANGFLLANDTVSRFDSASWSPLVAELKSNGAMSVDAELVELLSELHALPQTPAIVLPADSTVKISSEQPSLAATIVVQPDEWRATQMYEVRCQFVYGKLRVAPDTPGNTLFDEDATVLHRRQRATENAAIARVVELGAKVEWNANTTRRTFVVTQQKLTRFAASLVREGWDVQLDGVQLRAPGEMRATVSSGIDWFDLGGTVRYGDSEVPLARILDAQRRGLDVIPLADGGVGLLPTAWLERLGGLAATGEMVDGNTRFRRSQLPLLDVLLATLPEVTVDDTFATARAQLAQFRTIEPVDPPASFDGVLREYQRDGLGWMHFLRHFALGGCLADDMGLGKTVQVLALLDARRSESAGPSILVVPRSLVFNWIREAERFTPQLRILDYSNANRDLGPLDDVDVVITTYGTLRRDAAHLVEREFDYAILDEAQAIKNASTASAKACRLLRARNRLVLTGTPVENRIEELWSLLEFLNPGMLGASAKFAALSRPASADDVNTEAAVIDRALLSQALRPVILRRTKEKVAAELPERLEQTLEVELEPEQRAFYESIRDTQRAKVMHRIEQVGMQKSQMHILEALLRLRQAACHPVLADKSKGDLPSAKLDALVPSLAEVTAEGHKALVFSQFTEFLALVRQRLDEANIRYEYLDGKTVDRQARVDRFQNDDDCPVFLISLRAGGQGLNLTRADYVYLLDPWWNPAVEAQAIDRAHRIGQTRRVLATRLVARDTIEEKILQLQSSKRALADAILGADQGVLASIGREELELLLG